MAGSHSPSAARSGWVTFAGVMFIAAGGLNVLWGIAALADDDYFRVDELLFGDLSMWGWLYIIIGAVQLMTAGFILGRSEVGAAAGIVLALFHAGMALLSIGAYPLWTAIALIIDGLVIYALTVHGLDYEP